MKDDTPTTQLGELDAFLHGLTHTPLLPSGFQVRFDGDFGFVLPRELTAPQSGSFATAQVNEQIRRAIMGDPEEQEPIEKRCGEKP